MLVFNFSVLLYSLIVAHAVSVLLLACLLCWLGWKNSINS